LSRHWPEFRRRFGDFRLEWPLSDAIIEFARRHPIAEIDARAVAAHRSEADQ
jgi:hypothetical protein